jgi:hypothetical protein
VMAGLPKPRFMLLAIVYAFRKPKVRQIKL